MNNPSDEQLAHRVKELERENLELIEEIAALKKREKSLSRSHINDQKIMAKARIDHKKAEKAQAEANHILRLVLDSIPVRVFWKNRESVYLGSNQAFAEDAGFCLPDDVVGKTDYDLFPSQAELFRKDDNDVMCSGKSRIFYEEPQGRPNGETNWLLTSKVPMLDKKQNIIGLLGTYQDITDRKQSEKEVRDLRNYLSSIINSMPSVLIGVDKHGRVTEWNHKATLATKISQESAKGQPFRKIFPMLLNELEGVEDNIKNAVNSQQTIRKLNVPRTDKAKTIYEDITIFPLVGAGSSGAVIRIDDVTEKVQMEEVLIQNEKMLSLGGLSAGMAHEINNPLGIILQTVQNMSRRLGTELVKNKTIASEIGLDLNLLQVYLNRRTIDTYLATIKEAGERAAKIVRSMLDFSRKSESKKAMHSINSILDSVIDMASNDYDLKKKYDFRSVDIRCDYGEIPEIMCTETEIAQVFLNLVKNAAQAMALHGYNGECPCITLTSRKRNNNITVFIQDNGQGMDAKTLKKVFEPFYTSKSPGEGTGLGLSVSYFIITTHHGGSIDVSSQPGQGTCFTIELPIDKGKEIES